MIYLTYGISTNRQKFKLAIFWPQKTRMLNMPLTLFYHLHLYRIISYIYLHLWLNDELGTFSQGSLSHSCTTSHTLLLLGGRSLAPPALKSVTLLMSFPQILIAISVTKRNYVHSVHLRCHTNQSCLLHFVSWRL